MRIRMKETRRGTEDGYTVREYAIGREYELAPTERGEELGRVFVQEGWAEVIKSEVKPPDPRSPEALKMIGATPERVAALAKEDAKATASAPTTQPEPSSERQGQGKGSRKGQ